MSDRIFDCLFLLVASYLDYEDQIRFTLLSSHYSHLYLKGYLRTITLPYSHFYSPFLSNQSHREAILNKLSNPYQQLNIHFVSDDDDYFEEVTFQEEERGTEEEENEKKERRWSISPCHSFHSLKIDFANFYYYFYQNKQLERIHSLTLFPEESDPSEVSLNSTKLSVDQVEEILHFLAKRNDSSSSSFKDCEGSLNNNFANSSSRLPLGLESLELHFFPSLEVFPFIPNLKSLELNLFPRLLSLDERYFTSSLQKLKLCYCDSLEDVSMLDSIYDLSLVVCRNLEDISCLNHNHSIEVKYCSGIKDYSKCFRFSHRIGINVYKAAKIDILQFTAVQSLTIEIFQAELAFQFPDMLPSSLRYLYLNNLMETTYPRSFEGLKEISFYCCANPPPLELLSNIPVISITCTSGVNGFVDLFGLGPGNRSVKIQSCSGITDFSPLRFCQEVKIMHCMGLRTISELNHIQSLTICSCDQLTDLKGLREGTVKSLTIAYCKKINSWEGIEDIPHLHISIDSIEQLHDLKNYTKNQIKLVLDISCIKVGLIPEFTHFLYHVKLRYHDEYDSKKKILIFSRKKNDL